MKAFKASKKLFLVLFVIALASATILAHYTNISTYSSAYVAYAEAQISAKQEFARVHRELDRDLKIDPNVQSLMYDDIMADETLDYSQREAKLNEIGYYTFSYQEQPSTLSGSQDMEFQIVYVTYNSADDTWKVGANIRWYDSANRETGIPGSSALGFSVGQKFNVGGEDYAGVLLSNIVGDTSGVSIKSSTMRISGDNTTDYTNPNRVPMVDSIGGAVFGFQDYTTITKTWVDWWNPFVQHYEYAHSVVLSAVSLIFSSNFANIHGNLTGYYGHTWEDVKLNSIGFQTNGFNFGWSSSSGNWDAKSGFDVQF